MASFRYRDEQKDHGSCSCEETKEVDLAYRGFPVELRHVGWEVDPAETDDEHDQRSE